MRLIIASMIIIHFYSSNASLIEKIFQMYGEPYIRFNRSGYPKFPTTSSVSCGTRNIDFIPERSPKIVGGVQPPYGAYPWLVLQKIAYQPRTVSDFLGLECLGNLDPTGLDIPNYILDLKTITYSSRVFVQVDIKLFRPDQQKFEHHCGGALIGPKLVLTAAHCLQPPIVPEHLRAVVGEYQLNEHDEHEMSYKIEKVIPHPDFRKVGPYSHDIALLKLGGAGVKFTSFVSPICLPGAEESPVPGTWCAVSGWGANNSSDVDTISPTLLTALVPTLSPTTCRRPEIYGGRQQPILDSMLCAGRLQGGVDACGGDSGGPLACPTHLGDRYVLAGIVSWGDGCAKKNRPGVYTKVGSYVHWVHETAQRVGGSLS